MMKNNLYTLLSLFLTFNCAAFDWKETSSAMKLEGDTLRFEDLIFANYFSPNGDSINDHFIIKNVENWPENSIRIFNRWGEIVYKKEYYQNEFIGVGNVSGVYAGNILSEGVYFFEFATGKGSTISGQLTLDR